MTTVYLIRHAQPNCENHDDFFRELSEKGLADRRLVTEFLADKQIDVVLSSPFRRAVDTVREFAVGQGLRVECVDDFRERDVGGVWLEDFAGFCRRQWEDFDYKLPGGESLREVQQRNIRALREVLQRYRGKRVAIGSHGTAMSTMINYFDRSFGYEDFERIRRLMPWVVRLTFDGETCTGLQAYDLFAGSCEAR